MSSADSVRRCLSLFAFSIRPLQAWCLSEPVSVWFRRALTVLPAYGVFLVLFGIRNAFGKDGWHWPEHIGLVLPVPLAFMFWMSIWDEGKPPRAALVRPLMVLGYAVMMIAAIASAYPAWAEYRVLLTFAAVGMAILTETGIRRPVMAVVHDFFGPLRSRSCWEGFCICMRRLQDCYGGSSAP